LAIVVSCGLLTVWSTPSEAQERDTTQAQEDTQFERVDDSSSEYGESSSEYGESGDEFSFEFGEGSEDYSPRYQSSDFEDLPPAMQALVIIICVLFLLVMVGITIFILYLQYKLLDAIPPQHRFMEPGMVWLLLIPCFNLIWNFFVFTRIPKSYQHYFYAHGRTDVGDCGATLGIWYSVCAVLVSIPCLNYITGIFCGPAMLVLIIIYLLKLHELKRQIPLDKAAPAMNAQNPYAM